MLSIRKHLAAVLGQHENDAVVIPKDEFFRFLAGGDGNTSSLYVKRLYAIFDMDKKGHVVFLSAGDVRGPDEGLVAAEPEGHAGAEAHAVVLPAGPGGHRVHHQEDDHGAAALVSRGVQRAGDLAVRGPTGPHCG
ncbi:hypothetical protein ON010_g18877 [Phytophthora cinnamomi]|nr:hypothetical protein ON010_g18877 [Phytophthora cinnamomi]